jgi:hypothetical protein
MNQVSDILSTVIDDLELTMNIYAVSSVVNGVGENWKAWTLNTYYLHTGMRVTLGGIEYKIIDFSQNKYLVLDSEDYAKSEPSTGNYTIDNPFFIWGKYKKANAELAYKSQQPYQYMPFIWMFELQPRTQPEAVDSVIQSEGIVRLFFMNTYPAEDYTTADHYTQIIKPMDDLVDRFVSALKKSKYIGILGTITRTNHANFTNGGSLTAGADQKVLDAGNLSGIEVEIDLPIKRNMTCPVREIPIISGAFDASFDQSFDID